MPPNLPAPPERRALSIAEALTLQSTITFAYTLLVIAAASHPNSLTGQLVDMCIAATDGILSFLFGSSLQSPVSASISDGVAIYRHVLLVCVCAVTISFVMTRQHFAAWADIHKDQTRSPVRQGDPTKRALLVGYRVALIGLSASVFLIFLGEARLSEAGWDPSTPNWTLFRAPVLTSIAYWFACHAWVFRFRNLANIDDGV